MMPTESSGSSGRVRCADQCVYQRFLWYAVRTADPTLVDRFLTGAALIDADGMVVLKPTIL